jgi:tetratricopeptide (TPR) repeat protein
VRFLELQIASNLNLLGYIEAAESRYRRSFQLYPDNVYSNLAWPQFLLSHARYGEAQVALEQALQRGNAHAGLYLLQAELALQRGDSVAAAAASQHALALRPQASLPQTMAWLSAAEPLPAPAILRERAQRVLHGLDAGADAADGLEAALLLQAAGDPRAALLALNQAISHGYRDGAYLRASPLLQRLRSAAGFADALAALEHRIVLEREQVRRHGRLPATIGSAAP